MNNVRRAELGYKFTDWWWCIGSGMRPAKHDDISSHSLRVAKAAWIAAKADTEKKQKKKQRRTK